MTPPTNRKQETILIADDDARVLDTFARNLQLSGYTVLTATGGEEAIQIYTQEHPDIVLADVRMPQVDGFQVLDTIHEHIPEAEVILVTGHGDMDTAISALRAGASDFIPKPIEKGVLNTALKRARERIRLRRELRTAREELRASEEHYRAITETTFVGVAIVDPDETLSFVNQAFAEMTGYTRDQLVGMNLSQLSTPEEFARYQRLTQRRKAGERDQYETTFLRQDGTSISVLVSASPLRDANGHFKGTLAATADITERKQAEQALAWEAGVNAAIAELSKALISTASVESTAGLTLEIAKRLTDSRYGFVGYIDPQTGYLVSPTLTRDIWDTCLMEEEEKDIIFEDFSGLWGWVLEQRKSLLTNTPDDDARSSGIPQGHVPINHFLSAPAMFGDNLLGQVAVANPDRDYTEQDLVLIERLASLYALSIQRYRADQTLRQYAEEQAALYTITSVATSSLDPEELLSTILDQVLSILETDAGWITIPDITLDAPPHIIAWRGVPDSFIAAERTSPLKSCPACTHVITVGTIWHEPLLMEECTRVPRDVLAETGLHDHIGIPLSTGDHVLGVLNIAWRAPHPYTEAHRTLLTTIGRQVGLALHNAQLYQAARQVDRLQVLNELDRNLSATLDPQKVIEITLQHVITALDAPDSILFVMLDHTENRVQGFSLDTGWTEVNLDVDSEAEPDRQSIQHLYSLLQQLQEQEREEEQEIIQFSAQDLERIHQDGALDQRWVSPGVAIPIRDKDALTALLLLGGRPVDRPFTDEDQALGRAVAARAGQAIRNARLYQTTRQQSERLAILNDISAAATASLNPDTVLRQVLALSCEAVNAAEGSILLIDPDTDELIFSLTLVDETRGLPGLRLAAGQGIAGWVAQRRQAVYVNHVAQDERWCKEIDAQTGFKTHSLLCSPLIQRGEVIGVIEIVNKLAGSFDDADLKLMEAIAAIAAVALENARLYTNTRARADEMALLNEIGLALTSTLDILKIIHIAMAQIQRLFHAEKVGLLRPDPQTGELQFLQTLVEGTPVELPTRLQPGEGLVGWVMENRQSVVVDDALADPRYVHQEDPYLGEPPRALMAVPLLTQETVIGIILVASTEVGIYDQEQLHTLQAVATPLAMALENASLYDDLKSLLHEREEAQAQLIHAEKIAALGRLTASIAHEINNPLQAVQGCLTLADEELDEQQRKETLKRYLNIATSEIERVSVIVRRMRDFYRPAQKGMEETDVHAVLQSVLDLTQKQLQHSDVTVERAWEDLVQIQANPDHLKQVFLNLVLNAIDAMPEGGTLHVNTAMEHGMVQIQFRDTGLGIPSEALPHLFEPFFTTKEHGSGLGLSISYGIIESHNGEITVSSEMNGGTTFTILLPIQQPNDNDRLYDEQTE